MYRANPDTLKCFAATSSEILVASPAGTHSSHTRRQSNLEREERKRRRGRGGEEEEGGAGRWRCREGEVEGGGRV